MAARLIKHSAVFSVCILNSIIMADTLALEEDKRTGKAYYWSSESFFSLKAARHWNPAEIGLRKRHHDTEKKNERHAIRSIPPSLPSTPTPLQAVHLIKSLYTYPHARTNNHGASLLLYDLFAMQRLNVPAAALSQPLTCRRAPETECRGNTTSLRHISSLWPLHSDLRSN